MNVQNDALCIGIDLPLKLIDGAFCRVQTFFPYAYVDDRGSVRCESHTAPYGFLFLESTNLPKDKKCFYRITHKDDFKHTWEAFKELDKSTQEIIVVYQDNPYQYHRSIWLKLQKNILPKLHVFIYKKGGLEKIYEHYSPAGRGGVKGFEEIMQMRIKEWEPLKGLNEMR